MNEFKHRFAFNAVSRKIRVNTGKVELGQHVHSAFRNIVSNALAIDINHIESSPVNTHISPDDGMTVGSLSMQVTGASLQADAYALRAILIQEACQVLGCDDHELELDAQTLDYRVKQARCSIFDLPTAKRTAYTAMTFTAMNSADDSFYNASIASSIKGTRRYIQDLTLLNMIHARALRGRTMPVEQCDKVSVVTDGGFSAVVATTEAALDAAWTQVESSTDTRDATCDGPLANWIHTGEVKTHSSGETSTINGTVAHHARRAFVLHASIAPSCALALYQHGLLEIWTHSQGIFPLRDTIAQHLGMAKDKLMVRHVPSAGCYGHNAADDAAMDAVLVSLQHEGFPVRVLWTRQDDFQYSPIGAAMQVHAEAQLSNDKAIDCWRQTVWSCPHAQRPGSGGNVNLLAAMEQDATYQTNAVEDLADTIGGGASRNARPPYRISSIGVTTHIVQDVPVRTSSIRGLGAQMNVVCIESVMDQLATHCKTDPIEFRLQHLDDPRGRDVLLQLRTALNTAVQPLTDSEAIGVAYSRYKDKSAFAAVAARVRLSETVELLELWVVVDAGHLVDRSGALNQIEGGIIQAASWTLFEGALLRNGFVDVEGWDDYPIIGWASIPKIHASLVNDKSGLPYLGVGECMVGPVSAAIVNAVSIVAGCSMTDLPLTPEKFLQAAAVHQ